MLTTNPVSDQTGSLTGTLPELIRPGKAITARWLRENASLRAEVGCLETGGTELRAALPSRSGEAPS